MVIVWLFHLVGKATDSGAPVLDAFNQMTPPINLNHPPVHPACLAPSYGENFGAFIHTIR
jgi:hypothetical protein